MAAFLITLASLIALGVAAVRGWLPDTRDPEFSLGRVVRGHDQAAPEKAVAANSAAPSTPSPTGSSGQNGQRLASTPGRRRTRLANA